MHVGKISVNETWICLFKRSSVFQWDFLDTSEMSGRDYGC